MVKQQDKKEQRI